MTENILNYYSVFELVKRASVELAQIILHNRTFVRSRWDLATGENMVNSEPVSDYYRALL
jgi:hypothetical protein